MEIDEEGWRKEGKVEDGWKGIKGEGGRRIGRRRDRRKKIDEGTVKEM